MIKLLSLFSGIGAFEKALENIGEPYELINYCEIDKYAATAFSLIHHIDENMNLIDVCSIETEDLPSDIDFITYGFPCQDISISGKMNGFTDDTGNLTRSGLFFEALRIIEDVQPRIAIAENVKGLTGKRFTAEFKIVLDSLNDAGYKNYWAVLNSKDYGVPQNRERVFIISIRNDIDHGFQFPAKYELKLRLKDLLESNVDDKYYIKDFDSVTMINELYGVINGGVIGNSHDMIRRVYNTNGISPTIHTCQGGHRQPKIILSDDEIRKLTPKECFRLMGFDDKDCDVLSEHGISNSQLYKMAGNSIVVDVLEEIFVELLNQYEDVFPYSEDRIC